MRLRLPSILLAALLLALVPGVAAAADPGIVPGRVIVRYAHDATHRDRVLAERATGTGHARALPGGHRELVITDGKSVDATLAKLRARPDVAEAHPDYVVRAAGGYYPNDPGIGGLGDWRNLQWNFAGSYGIRAPKAWAKLRALGRDGGRGVVVAVIDSGVAYRDYGDFIRAPDLYRGRFTSGYDFIDNDRHPLDDLGHGTHVTGTIAEHVNNKKAVTGIAYGVHVMPVRILSGDGRGDTADFAQGIVWAADHGADVINMSLEFTQDERARDIPAVIDAIRYAHDKGVVMVGAAGNNGRSHLSYPGRDRDVISVAASTADGCEAEYSEYGDGLDVTAPGGGGDEPLDGDDWDRAHCDGSASGRSVWQQTFDRGDPRSFHLYGFSGTSESTPHVSAIAALVIASGVVGSHPKPYQVRNRIQGTARDLGPPGYDKRYGYGLVDATAAVGG
jgi:serine protease